MGRVPVFLILSFLGILVLAGVVSRVSVLELHDVLLLTPTLIGALMGWQVVQLRRQRRLLEYTVARCEAAQDETRLLLSVSRAIGEAPTFGAALERTLQTVSGATLYVYGEVWLPDHQLGLLKMGAVWCERAGHLASFVERSRAITFAPGCGLPGRVWAKREPEWVPDVLCLTESQFPRRLAAEEAGLKAALGVPIVAQGEVLAVLCLFMTESHPEDDRLVELVSAVAMGLGPVILRKRVEDELRPHRERLLTRAVEQVCAAIMITDRAGRIEYVNPWFSRVTGYSSAEALGRTPRLISSGRQSEDFYRDMWATIVRGEEWRGELWNRRKDGDLYWQHASISPIMDAGGEITQFVAVFADATEQKRLSEALAQALHSAEAADRAKTAFLANTSHEIRTPMNAIIGMAELLLQSRLTDGQRDYAETIFDSAVGLQGVVNDILDLTKMEAGYLKLDQVPFDLRACTEGLERMLAPRAAEKGVRLALEYAEAVPSRFVGDSLRLRQVLVNLVGNALKFTERGQVVLRVECLLETLDAAILRISVVDSGVGIPTDRQREIFEAFTQADASTTRVYGGSGLGLTISAQLVEMMGGRLEVESDCGTGSTFHFTLVFPHASRELDLATTCNGASLPPVAARPRFEACVLVADDSVANQKVARGMLEGLGCRVDVACDGLQALQLAMRKAYDIVFMDCSMPVMDGCQATRRLREHEGGVRHTPVVALTAHAMQGDEDECRRAGMDDYVVKPVSLRRFHDILARYCEASGAAPLHDPPPLDGDADFDPGVLFVSTRGNADTTRDVVDAFMEDCRDDLALMSTHVLAGDTRQTGEVAHKLKGSAATVGALALSALARRMNDCADRGDAAACGDLLAPVERAYARLGERLVALHGAAVVTSTRGGTG